MTSQPPRQELGEAVGGVTKNAFSNARNISRMPIFDPP